MGFFKKRFLRLAPNIWLSVILLGILSIFIKGIHWSFDGNFLRLFLLQSVGFSPSTGGTSLSFSWFVSALLWSSLFYVYIFKIFEKKYLNLIIWLLSVFCYAIYIQYNHFTAGTHSLNAYLIFNIGVCRALASIGLGYFLSMAYKENFLQNIKTKGILIISVCEAFLVGFLAYYLIFSGNLPCKTVMGYIFPFAILFYFMLIKKGFISKLLDNDLLGKFDEYAYSIYCFHGVTLAVFKHYPIILTQHPLLAYSFQTLCAVVIGIGLYYIFEKPVANYIKNKNF